MLASVAAYIRRHGLIAPGDRVLVAVSGGADSLALLHLLAELAARWPLELVAAHLDHAIRRESPVEAQLVAQRCATLGVPLVSVRIDVPELSRREKRGLEDAGRQARRRFLRQAAKDHGCRSIALGHHRDDQAETVLLRLLRGSGPTGLAAMRPKRPPFIRPLLGVSAAELRAWLSRREIAWCEDASNRDEAFTRNRIRRRLLPLLREFNPQLDAALVRLSERLAGEEDYWQELSAATLERLAEVAPEGLRLDVVGLRACHPALRDRVLRLALERLRGDLVGIAAQHVAALAALLEKGPQAEAHLPGVWSGRRYDTLLLQGQPPAHSAPYCLEIAGPGRYALPGGRWLEATLAARAVGETAWRVEFAAAAVDWPLLVRPFAAGDRVALPAGGRQKVKEVLRAARLPQEERARRPLVIADEVLWVAGLRRCAGRRPVAGRPVLRLTFAARNNL